MLGLTTCFKGSMVQRRGDNWCENSPDEPYSICLDISTFVALSVPATTEQCQWDQERPKCEPTNRPHREGRMPTLALVIPVANDLIPPDWIDLDIWVVG